MDAVEIEEAVSEFEKIPFNADEFPYKFLSAYGNKNTTIKKIREGSANKSEEWFLVPLEVIKDTINKIMDGSITQYYYDPSKAELRKRNIDDF